MICIWDTISILCRICIIGNYLYVENHWNSAIPGNVEKLHHDYCVLNGRISQRYGLSKDKISALDITTEPICELAVF